jgi:hypothetical protein
VKRRALGRGRLLIVIGALITVVGLVPTWWTLGGTVTIRQSGNGFTGVGIVIFLAALALIAVVTLPYARRDGESSLDTPGVYVALAFAAIAAFVWRGYEIYQFGGLGLPPASAGFWITALGLLIVIFGVADVFTEKPRPTY